MFSRPLSEPLAQGFLCSTTPGGRVDLEDKTANRQHHNFTGNEPFSQALGEGLWINKALDFSEIDVASPHRQNCTIDAKELAQLTQIRMGMIT
jgi:hypothetical protein